MSTVGMLSREQIEAEVARRMPEIAAAALLTGKAAFEQRVSVGATSGPAGPDSLHMRAGTIDPVLLSVDRGSPFMQWTERTLDGGARFAGITRNKAWTAAEFGMDTDVAVRKHGDEIPDDDDGRRYTGGVCYRAEFDHEGQTYKLSIVVACSGVVGTDDRMVSYTVALTIASEWEKLLKKLLGIR
jgi:hypothetical protein